MRKVPSVFRFLLTISAVALGMSGLTSVAQAQGADEEIEEIIVSGLRGKPRTAVDSAVPIDTFDVDSITAVAHTDVQDILQTLVPSYNVGRQPISDGASFIRPAELRGLPSHHTLVLINGKRRHRAALVSIGGSGTQGPDVATIPSFAIQSIEVLRDGAAAQYGSDAIAGVINFNLKDNSSGFAMALNSGQYFEGDGQGYTVSANVGLPLGDNGFLSISGEIDQQDFSERAHQYCDTWYCVDKDNPIFQSVVARGDQRADYVLGVPTPGLTAYENGLQLLYPAGVSRASVAGKNVMPWGQPNVESARFFYNAGIELDNGTELYSFGNYSASKGDGSFFYRYPGNGTIEILRNADGSYYSPLEKFPGGFTPRFEGEIEDMSVAGGVRGETDGGFSYDASVRYGSNDIDYRLFNTVNPSYGSDSPTDFKPGILQNEELQFQLDLANEFDMNLESPVVVAYGLSWMEETYDVKQTPDVASYAAGPHALKDPFGFCTTEADMAVRTATAAAGGGEWTSSVGGMAAVAGDTIGDLDCTDSFDPVYKVVGVGSNGFPGYSPAFSEKYTRDSYAVYGDVSADVSENFFLQAAVRYEDYSDFGSKIVGKVAGRYRINDTIAIRGSFGTGFRAPTPGQQGTTNVSTRLPQGLPVATGLFPATGSVAQALGAVPLRPETSTSYTVGFTADFENLTVTVDYYSIDIDDRFNAISTLNVCTDPGCGSGYNNYLALVGAGVAGAETIGGVLYFTNAYNSSTTGIDLVASYPLEWNNGQSTHLQFAINYNKNELTSDASQFLNAEARFDFENADPNTRWNLTANHSFSDSFSMMLRGRYYGTSENSDNTSPYLAIQGFDSTFFLDLDLSYQVNDNWRVSVGGRNILDAYPDKTDKVLSDNDQCCGRDYVSGSLVPWMGGYLYARVSMSYQ